jgi:hypothetical protein
MEPQIYEGVHRSMVDPNARGDTACRFSNIEAIAKNDQLNNLFALKDGASRRLDALLVLTALAILDEIIDHGGIGERRGIPEASGFVLRDLAQDAAHDFAGTGLWQARRELDLVGRGDRPDVLAHPGNQLFP